MDKSITNKSLLINDVRLAYYKSNTSFEQTVVLLHGYCGSSSYYSKLVPLVEKYANVIVFDLFGHGKSEPLDEEKYQLEKVATFIHTALLQLEQKPVYMFGHSLGGYITLAYAKQYETHLKGFGLIHSTALPDSEAAKQNRLNVIEAVKQNGVTDFAKQLVEKLFGEQPNESDVTLAKEIGFQTTIAGVVGFAHAMRERMDAQQIIQSASCPVLLLAGEQDKIVKPEQVFAGQKRETVCVTIKDVGHMGMLEDEYAVSKQLQQFVCN